MHPTPALRGSLVVVVARRAPLHELVAAYRHSPQAFGRQFGRPVQDLPTVMHLAESALAHGFCSYFDVHLRSDDTLIGHLRVDWSIDEGLICLHGGSPLDDPSSTGHRQRAHARARDQAWRLMVQAALDTPGVQRVGTATAASNRAAQAFIAATGFRRTRVLQLPDGRETQVHYRLIRPWFDAAGGAAASWPSNDEGLKPYFPPRAKATSMSAPTDVPSPPVQDLPAPAGWTRIDAAGAPRWIDQASTQFLRSLADMPPRPASRDDVVQTLFFEAAHGTQFFGHPTGPGSPAQALIAAKPLPQRPGWWVLRGGPLTPQLSPPALRPWLDTCFEHAALRRVEAQVQAGDDKHLAWWRGCGLAEEGITEIDRQGCCLAYTLARVAA